MLVPVFPTPQDILVLCQLDPGLFGCPSCRTPLPLSTVAVHSIHHRPFRPRSQRDSGGTRRALGIFLLFFFSLPSGWGRLCPVGKPRGQPCLQRGWAGAAPSSLPAPVCITSAVPGVNYWRV